jgi:hypothetical protein
MEENQLQEEIGRVLESGTLSSAQLRRILEYLGKAAADGREDLKEYTIGVEALAKPHSYDPQMDSTVRVQVGKLREKLDSYYREEGADHPLRLSLPKGTFRLRLVAPPQGIQSAAAARPWIRIRLGLGIAGLLIVIFLLGYRLGNRKVEQATAASQSWTPEMRLFWKPLIGNGRPILVSYDVAMTIDIPPWRLRNSELNDPEDLPKSREWQELSKKLGNPAVRTDNLYVGFGIANGTLMIGQLLSGHQLLPNVKRSNVLSWEDLSNGNLVFIGSGKTSKIIRSILERGDFAWDSSKERSTKIINLRPLPGEQAYFDQRIDPVTEEYRQQYGLISMMPGLNGDLQVLVLGGGTSEGDWAMSQYVTESDHVRELVGHLRDKSGNIPRAYQVIVKITYGSRVPISTSYVTHHVLSIPSVQRESQQH